LKGLRDVATVTRRGFLTLAGAIPASAAGGWGAADELTPGQHALKLDSVRDGVIYVPRGYRPGVPTPLVVMFHGAGSSGLNTQYVWPLADELGFILLAPDSRDERTWDIALGSYGPDAEFLGQALRHAASRCSIDRARMSVAGHSDGASYSLSFGIGAGDVFGHVIALSPGLMTPIAARGKPRIFIAHGVNDMTMPIDVTSRIFVPRLRKLDYDVTYREYDGGHRAPAPIVREAFEWIQR
jgi:phospholipase/carboxylesterase